MSDLSAPGAAPKVHTRERDAGIERSTETKASTKTSEFFTYLVAAAAILIREQEGIVDLNNEGRSGQVDRDERRTYGIAEWAATLRARRTEKELAALAAVTREFPFPRLQSREVRVRGPSGAPARA